MFDLVVCALAIHCASDRGAAFAGFFRVLRPGGAVVVPVQHPVMDWLRMGGCYSGTTLETGTWRIPGGDRPVRFWREPLSALCAAASAGFLTGQVTEPLPADSMRERYPDDYRKLTAEPGFLRLRLVKIAGRNAPDLRGDPASSNLRTVTTSRCQHGAEPAIWRRIRFTMAEGQSGTDLALLCDPDAVSRGCRTEEPVGCAREFAQLLPGFQREHDPG